MKKIANVVGARPNFMKMAPIHRRMQESSTLEPILIHTGQHYDEKMSKTFFNDLGMPEPDIYLGVGSGTHAQQTAAVMVEMEKLLQIEKPDLLIVVGDVNSTIAASLAAAKLQIPVAHVESGLRSFDMNMPEEINRILTDRISDYLFVTEQSGLDNLKLEGVAEERVFFVGNVMIDSLIDHLEKAGTSNVLEQYKLQTHNYALMTLHRPSNVDDEHVLENLLNTLQTIQDELPIIFPIHPRTRKMITQFGLDPKIKAMSNLILTEPLGYLSFLQLMSNARVILTDSEGIQEESSFLGIPCLTLRENTERPVTITLGTNQLVGLDGNSILNGFQKAMQMRAGTHSQIPLWDGKASVRIVNTIEKHLY